MVLASLVAFSLPVTAITNGTPDVTHTFVGAVKGDLPGSALGFRLCSGVLLSPRVVVTAGHCINTFIANGITPDKVSVSFAADAFAPPETWLPAVAYFAHPDFSPLTLEHDLGVVVLASAVSITPGNLAPVGYLTDLKREGGLRGAEFSMVGYGVDEDFVFGIRRLGLSDFQGLRKGIWLITSATHQTSNGGVCLGDSGGAALHDEGGTEWVVAIHSWLAGDCGVTDGVGNRLDARLDTTSAQSFVLAAIAGSS